MSKFKIIKRYSLEYLGDDWKECYLDFEPLTVKDITGRMSVLASVDKDNADSVKEATDEMMELLGSRLVGGKGYDGKGLVDIEKGDLEDLPVEVLTGAVSFLSQSQIKNAQ